MNQYVIQFDYELWNDKVELNFFHHIHLVMHQVQEVSNKNIFLNLQNKKNFLNLTTIASFRLYIADLCNGVKPPLRVRKSK